MTKNTETLSGAEAVQAGFSHSKTIEITMAALFIALTYVATALSMCVFRFWRPMAV